MAASGWQMSLYVVLLESQGFDLGIFVSRCHFRLGRIFFTLPALSDVALLCTLRSAWIVALVSKRDEGCFRSKTCKEPLRVSSMGADEEFFQSLIAFSFFEQL